MEIGILTDSTADLNENILKDFNIDVIPLSIHFGEEVFRDGIDISSEDFFKKMARSEKLPQTSQPTPNDFKKIYKKMSQKYDEIISLHISSGLSGTFNSAQTAAQQLPDIKIYPVDSSSISLGLGFLTIMAAKLAETASSAEQVIEKINKAKDKIFLFFTVDDMTYMEKGGRIGKARSLLGSFLNINPIISLSTKTGEVDPLAKVRGSKKTLQKMLDIAMEQLKDTSRAWLGFAHGDREEDLYEFKNKLLARIDQNLNLDYEIFQTRISSTIGCHVGPSVYAGVIFTAEGLLDFKIKSK